MLENGNLVERVWITIDGGVIACHLQHAMTLCLKVSVADVADSVFDAFRRKAGEKTEASSVDAHNWNILMCHLACCVEKGAVASYADNVVGCEVAVCYHLAFWQVDVGYCEKEFVEWLIYGDFCMSFFRNVEETLHSRAFVLLIDIAEEGKLYVFSHI